MIINLEKKILIINNYIHDCGEFGIYFNSYLDGPGRFTTMLYNNRIENCGSGSSNSTTLPYVVQDPGVNPNRPQAWYQSTSAIQRPFLVPAIPMQGEGLRVITICDLKGQQVRSMTDEFSTRSFLDLNKGLPSGLYLVRVLKGGSQALYKKLLLK